ncbi:MAG: methyl-accepting chemotaxis protein [Gemmatimonadales bacterium]
MIKTIRGRQAGAFTVLLLGLLATGLLGISSLNGLSREFDAEMAKVRQVSEIGTDLQRDVLELIFAAEGYLASGSRDSKRRFAELAGRTQDVGKRYRELEGMGATEAQQVERLTAALTQLEVEFAGAHALYDIGRRAEAREVADAAHPLAEEVASLISALSERQSQVLQASTAALQSRARERSNYVLTILALAFVLGTALAVLTVRSIDRPLAVLVSAAAKLGSGDLRTRVSDEAMPKEFAAVGAAFDSMAGGLRNVAEQVIVTASQVSSSAAEFSAISEQVAGSTHEVAMAMSEISEGADGQARALSETAAAVVELRDGAARIESDAHKNRQLSHTVRREASESRESVQQAVELLLSLREVIHSSAEEMEGLQAASNQITGFVKRITSIAEQSHLLSLNAAIEAAHAGHEGRGFSVVAEEVRKLAAESDSAAQEVDETVNQFRDWVVSAVARMREGELQVAQVENVSRAAQGALDSIAVDLERITHATDQALATVERSLVLLEQVAGHVETVTATATAHAARSQDVSAAVQEQSATTEQISASVAELVTAANDLRRVVSEWEI